MAGGPLAVPTFVTGARDDVAATDVYTRTTSTPINSIQTIANQSDVLGALGMRGGKSMSLSMPSLNSLLAVGKSLLGSKGDPLVRLTQAAGPLASALKSMSPGSVSGILGSITSSLGGVASLGGVKSLIPTVNIGNASSIGNLINSVTSGAGGFSMLDKGALSGGLSGIINTATSVGLKGSFGPIMSGITDKTIINSVAGSSLAGVIRGGDLGSLSSMASMCSSGALKTINPNILNDVASNFSAPPGTNYLDSLTNFSSVQDTFKKIDPPWGTGTRETAGGTDSIGNITSIQGCSKDFQTLLSNGIKSTPGATFDQQNLLLGSVFPRVDVGTDLQKDFPLTALSGNSSMSNQTSDPRAVPAMQQRNLSPQEAHDELLAIKAASDKATQVYNDKIAVLNKELTGLKATWLEHNASGNYTPAQLVAETKVIDAVTQDKNDLTVAYIEEIRRYGEQSKAINI